MTHAIRQVPGAAGAWMLVFIASLLVAAPRDAYAQTSMDRGRSGSAEADTSDARVEGRVLQEESGTPLSGATVAVRVRPDSQIVTGTTTDSTGAFSVRNLAAGIYDVDVSFIGYDGSTVSGVRLTREQPVRDLGTIRLSRSTRQLGDVTVEEARPSVSVKIDRTVYDTGAQLTAAGGTARTVLDGLPSIRVSFDGSVSLRGNESVVVQINGKPTSLDGESLSSFLQSIPASSVESVEVIPNPSAKEEPEGAAGIINIILDRNREAGWSGGGTVGGGTPETVTASANAGYQGARWRLYASYGVRTNEETDFSERYRRAFLSGPDPIVDRSKTQEDRDLGHTINLQAEVRPTDSTTLSMETVASLRRDWRDTRTRYVESVVPGASESPVVQDRYLRLVEASRGGQNLDARLSGTHTFDGEHELSARVRYEFDRDVEDGQYATRSFYDGTPGAVRSRERDEVRERDGEATLEVDYARPFGEALLETGYQGEVRRIGADQLYEVQGPQDGGYRVAQDSDFDYRDRTHAVYGQVTLPLGRGFSVKGGLRAEQTARTITLPQSGETVGNPYANLFPSAFLTYESGQRYVARLSYSRRIRRPRSWQLDPIDDNDNPDVRFGGNPRLDPEYVHSVEMKLTRKWATATLSITPFYRRTTNEIGRVEQLGSDGVTVLTFRNFAASNSYGIEVTTSLDLDAGINGNVTFNANRVETNAASASSDLSSSGLAYSVRGNLTFDVGYGVDVQMSPFYRAPRPIAGGQVNARYGTDVALSRELFDGAGSISLRGSDVFETRGWGSKRATDDLLVRNDVDWSQRSVTLSVSYSFGK